MIDSKVIPAQQRTIIANTPANGYSFTGWTGDIGALANPLAMQTVVTMPDSDVHVVANYITDSTKIILDGKVYDSVQIGNLLWTNENLAYNDNNGGLYYPNNNIANVLEYGYLYTYAAGQRIKTLLASLANGWRLPTTTDCVNTENALGGTQVAGKKMKEAGTVHWQAGNTGTNETGFNGRGAGIMYMNGYYQFGQTNGMILDDLEHAYLYYMAALGYNYDKWDATPGQIDALTAWSIRLCKNV